MGPEYTASLHSDHLVAQRQSPWRQAPEKPKQERIYVMSLRAKSLVAATGALLGACALVAPSAAPAEAASSAMPTLKIALHGTQGVTLSGSTVSGAVNIVSTFAGKAPTGPNSNGPTLALFQLRPGATIQEAFGAVGASGDLN